MEERQFVNVYMLQHADTGLYYKRRGGWVPQCEAAIWTNLSGVNAGKGSHHLRGQNVIVRTFRLEKIDE
jgi:hypothetical protein